MGFRPELLALAHALGVEESSVTGLIDRAERRGLVERLEADYDGRAVHVRLTPLGQEMAGSLTEQVSEHIAILTAPLARRDRDRLASLATRRRPRRRTTRRRPRCALDREGESSLMITAEPARLARSALSCTFEPVLSQWLLPAATTAG